MNKHKIGDIVATMGHWFRVIGVTETGYQLELLTMEEAIQQEKKDKLSELYKKLNIIYEKLYTMELSELSLNSNYYEIEIIKLKHQIKEIENEYI